MKVNVVLPNGAELPSIYSATPFEPFATVTVEFLSMLSTRLLSASQTRDFPELIALGYWLRKSHLKLLEQHFTARAHDEHRLPRGLVFHVAPSNVDTIFVYSWALSMLCGNSNLVRLSSRHSVQIDTLMQHLASLLEKAEFTALRDRVRVVRYEHNDDSNKEFSARCAVRVIWGGDETIASLRRAPLPATSTELAFADKFSLALIDAAGWLALPSDEQTRQCELFRADATGFNQQACSSPRLVVWLGTDNVIARAKTNFWQAVNAATQNQVVPLSIADASNRVLYAQSAAIAANARLDSALGARFLRLWIEHPDTLASVPFCGAGVFLESSIRELSELQTFLSRRIQTLSTAGFTADTLQQWIRTRLPAGVDRIVPFGAALSFQQVWDGVDLFEAFTRRVTICL